MLCYRFGFCSNVVNQYSLVFLGIKKGAGINFHNMYTEIIKSRSSFEDLPIGLGKLVLRATLTSLTC